MAVVIAMLIISGIIKTLKNVYMPDMNYSLVLWATWVHNIFFVLFILSVAAHLAALVIKPNRPMVRGIFTGKVGLDYARRRHPLWINEIENKVAEQVSPKAEEKEEFAHEEPPGKDEGSDENTGPERAVTGKE